MYCERVYTEFHECVWGREPPLALCMFIMTELNFRPLLKVESLSEQTFDRNRRGIMCIWPDFECICWNHGTEHRTNLYSWLIHFAKSRNRKIKRGKSRDAGIVKFILDFYSVVLQRPLLSTNSSTYSVESCTKLQKLHFIFWNLLKMRSQCCNIGIAVIRKRPTRLCGGFLWRCCTAWRNMSWQGTFNCKAFTLRNMQGRDTCRRCLLPVSC